MYAIFYVSKLELIGTRQSLTRGFSDMDIFFKRFYGYSIEISNSSKVIFFFFLFKSKKVTQLFIYQNRSFLGRAVPLTKAFSETDNSFRMVVSRSDKA